MARLVILAAILACAIPSTAHAVEIRYADGAPAAVLQGWADASLVPVTPGTVTVVRAFCPGLEPTGTACIDLTTDRMWLSAWFAGNLRSTFAHELGHRFDWHRMTASARREFRRIMSYWRGAWWGKQGARSPSELFADAYSACFRIRVLRSWLASPYDYDPTPRQHRLVCRLIRQTAAGVYGAR